jgi:signal transduction histidine kinase
MITGENDLPTVTDLERVLTSLVDNAIKYSPDGGDLQIDLRKEDDLLLIAVSDQGIGIPENKLAQIIDRFYHKETNDTNDYIFGGLGLGFSTTWQVIKQHNGKNFVQSSPGKGSTFILSLSIWKLLLTHYAIRG